MVVAHRPPEHAAPGPAPGYPRRSMRRPRSAFLWKQARRIQLSTRSSTKCCWPTPSKPSAMNRFCAAQSLRKCLEARDDCLRMLVKIWADGRDDADHASFHRWAQPWPRRGPRGRTLAGRADHCIAAQRAPGPRLVGPAASGAQVRRCAGALRLSIALPGSADQGGVGLPSARRHLPGTTYAEHATNFFTFQQTLLASAEDCQGYAYERDPGSHICLACYPVHLSFRRISSDVGVACHSRFVGLDRAS